MTDKAKRASIEESENKRKPPEPIMISRKAIAAHIDECHHLYSMDIDVFIISNLDGFQSIQLKGRGIDKTFSSTKSAKAWLTKLNNKLICEAVDRRLAYV